MRYQKFIPHFGPVIGSNKVYVAGSDKNLEFLISKMEN